ncbi:MAG: HAD family phosphatase [Lachnospiraceae bacterium]|nr:HAD family phosphatase [Lachnospiraceae bacterium]
MAEIRNLVFDMGNVLLSYRWKEMLEVDRGLSPERAREVARVTFKSDIWRDYDIGDIDEAGAIKRFHEEYPDVADDVEWFINSSAEMPLPRYRTWELINELKKLGYRTYILSNYSGELYNMHTGPVEKAIDFDGRVVSYEVHLLKPDIRIYEALLGKYDLKAEECLFFDDVEANIEGARSAGMHGIVVRKEEELNALLESYVNLGKVSL